jgi:hypothetical protein
MLLFNTSILIKQRRVPIFASAQLTVLPALFG